MLANAEHLAAEFLFLRAALAEGAAGVVAAEERDLVCVRPAATGGLACLGPGEIEERFQDGKAFRPDGSRFVDPHEVCFDDFAGPDEIPDSTPVEDVGLEPGLVDVKPHAPGPGSG